MTLGISIMPSVTIKSIILNVIMLNVVMLNDIMINVIMMKGQHVLDTNAGKQLS
jgi:hypothetical protein